LASWAFTREEIPSLINAKPPAVGTIGRKS
jgi:hypothetical protein